MKQIVENVCKNQGHSIVSLVVADVLLPTGDGKYILAHKYETRCSRCSLTLQEIETYRRRTEGLRRRQKPAEGETSNATGV